MTNQQTAAMKTFEILMADGERPEGLRLLPRCHTVSFSNINEVTSYLRSQAGVKAIKRGYTTWRLYSGGKQIGTVQEL